MTPSFESFLVDTHGAVLSLKNGHDPRQIEADYSRWSTRIDQRLEWGRLMHENRALTRPAGELAAEVEEENVDAPAWSTFLGPKLPPHLRERLTKASAYTFYAWREIEAIRRELRGAVPDATGCP